jgi:hypothetical protein
MQGPEVFPKETVSRRGIKAAIEPSVVDCRPEAAESRAQASDSQRRISVLRGRKKQKPGTPFVAVRARSGTGRNKNDYRGILAGLEGVSGKKAADSEIMTVKN